MIPEPDGCSDSGSLYWDIDENTTLWWHYNYGRKGGHWQVYHAVSIEAGNVAPAKLLETAYLRQACKRNKEAA